MVSVKESEQLRNAINSLEAINNFLISGIGVSISKRYFVVSKIEKIIEFMDSIIC